MQLGLGFRLGECPSSILKQIIIIKKSNIKKKPLLFIQAAPNSFDLEE